MHLFHPVSVMRFSDEFGSVRYPHSYTKMETAQTSVHENTTQSLDALRCHSICSFVSAQMLCEVVEMSEG